MVTKKHLTVPGFDSAVPVGTFGSLGSGKNSGDGKVLWHFTMQALTVSIPIEGITISVAACGGVCALAALVSALSGCAALVFSTSRPTKALGCVQAYAMLSTRAAAPAAFRKLPPPQ